MSHVYRREVTITSRDCGTYNQCRPSAVLGILQDSATLTADVLGVDHHATMTKHQAVWMVARLWYQLSVPLYYGDTITVETWHRGEKGIFLNRDFEIYRNGVLIGEGLAMWILYGVESHTMLRMSVVAELENTTGGERCKTRTLKKLKAPAEVSEKGKRTFCYSDLDINGHVNNVKYVDIICDAIGLEDLDGTQFVSSAQIDYHVQCFPKEQVSLMVGHHSEGAFVAGVDQEGTRRFCGSVTTKTIP